MTDRQIDNYLAKCYLVSIAKLQKEINDYWELIGMIKVYIKVNEQHEITEVGSSIFIDDLTGWTYLDEGTGDKYAHAQNNYFDKPVINEDGSYNYLFINGKVYER
ncbi:MAG: hypothetical protein J6S85_15410 [Methanobrevibacter sp.]|nr:hypothetical protein [Methanobrevibacter sp.]